MLSSCFANHELTSFFSIDVILCSSLIACHQSKGDQVDSRPHLVFHPSFVQSTCREHMLPDLHPLWQIIVHHFSVLLMHDKNLINEVQELRVFFIKIVYVCSCFIFLTQLFVDKIKSFHSNFIPFILCFLKFFLC